MRTGFSLNPLELETYENRELAVERMVGEITEFFKKLYGSEYWGPSLNRIFQDGLRAVYERDDAPTLKDLYDLVSGRIDHTFREELKRLLRELSYIKEDIARVTDILSKTGRFPR